MKYRSVFDIIGPIMIGPSSSHTAGAARIGRAARTLFGIQPESVKVSLYGSFAETYKGHGTDFALVGGLLDFDTSDTRIPQSLSLAKTAQMDVTFIEEDAISDHPNTVRLLLKAGEKETEIVGISIGGGKIQIVELNGLKLNLSGMNPAVLVVHNDRYGFISKVTNLLAKYQVNISHMEVSRKEKGQVALMAIETDENISDKVFEEIKGLSNDLQVTRMIE
ncbi:L-serine ammonia-lyase, iron-sulfur-dependent subunit beta [Bacillus inaquosorum]|uniref:L-serine ammonia-lyase, iron-sulfur-dependent subunit beta n=1 Tax=Bacillus inaquosorum TaxID=483913 RepID=UPI002282B659|nr:L-serine ammonia-lyase, iron-sulfur-dependent subunit beta [Bacillus inaquosorum]MCY8844335.1 L-serine ammonia-lyase, iron-sulfur-dependent subunit beta [Bacillus inaquosorum]